MRDVSFERGYIEHPAGSCLACFGRTRVICTASVQAEVPRFLVGSGSGWVTAEYAMLPGSTAGGRKARDLLKRDSRNVEISRLIGRSLRAAVDLPKLGEITIVIDCDVLQADGGTRTAAISGGWVALHDALRSLAAKVDAGGPQRLLIGQVAAVSVGLLEGLVVCDLDYRQDSAATVDMNVVQRDGALVEVQGTAERGVFDRAQLAEMLDAADAGIREIYRAQTSALAS